MSKFIFATSMLLVGVTACLSAQSVQHQSEAIKGFSAGEYIAYLTHKKAGSDDYQGGINNRVWRILSIEPDKNQPDAHYEIAMMANEDPDRSAEKPEEHTSLYFPDHVAFPITYMRSVYEGNPKMQGLIGYVPRRERCEQRLVFLDDQIYFINDWKDKDNYRLFAVLEAGELPDGLIKTMKLINSTPKKMKALDPDAKLRAYLDAAYAARDAYYASWVAKPANKQVETLIEDRYKAMDAAINQANEDYVNSDYYKRVLANNRAAASAKAATRLTVKNTSSERIYVYAENSGATSELCAGCETTMDCELELFYKYSTGARDGAMFHRGNGGCGTVISIP